MGQKSQPLEQFNRKADKMCISSQAWAKGGRDFFPLFFLFKVFHKRINIFPIQLFYFHSYESSNPFVVSVSFSIVGFEAKIKNI